MNFFNHHRTELREKERERELLHNMKKHNLGAIFVSVSKLFDMSNFFLTEH